jgi:hypothetical protein
MNEALITIIIFYINRNNKENNEIIDVLVKLLINNME